ncbi:hypothetical protein DAPPUDRAFT_234000 [Daphnia pulex]|uniref:Uncharacterized protein n=1 Tax=Daphnia pulex TaxID=6669 RepID=E9FUB4_DAPPU|nr:hypothetical protein DAPPUDRAFT_234000 [Daphnia pulex]|eukprot:EFX88694.1 hypothetical protein DAPPUDRAFT_234000 [Daphnia pulex]
MTSDKEVNDPLSPLSDTGDFSSLFQGLEKDNVTKKPTALTLGTNSSGYAGSTVIRSFYSVYLLHYWILTVYADGNIFDRHEGFQLFAGIPGRDFPVSEVT